MKRTDTIHNYRHPTTRAPARCRLRIYDTDAGAVVVLTEIADNPGISITNTAEELATEITAAYDLDPAAAAWIEHYTPDSYREPNTRFETFDRITFTWKGKTASAPQWRRLAGEELRDLLPDAPDNL